MSGLFDGYFSLWSGCQELWPFYFCHPCLSGLCIQPNFEGSLQNLLLNPHMVEVHIFESFKEEVHIFFSRVTWCINIGGFLFRGLRRHLSFRCKWLHLQFNLMLFEFFPICKRKKKADLDFFCGGWNRCNCLQLSGQLPEYLFDYRVVGKIDWFCSLAVVVP